MSRWQTEFDNHPFQQLWRNLKDVIKQVKVDDDRAVGWVTTQQ